VQSGVEERADADLCFEQFGNGAAGLGGFDGGVKFGFIRAGDGGDEVEMTLRDGEAVADFVECDSRRGFELLRGHSGAAELRGQSHRKTSGVRRSEKLFRVGADAVFKARAERILRLFEDAMSVEMVPLPSFKPPCQTADALRCMVPLLLRCLQSSTDWNPENSIHQR